MAATESRHIPTTLLATTILVFVLVVWGGIVRLSGSGLAIPDWPLAEGRVLPRPHPNVLIEYVHRALAGLVGLLTLGAAIAIFRSVADRARLAALPAVAVV